ncbi:MAG: glycosyltransferase [Ferruginibacter sp.]|nr:glycosyltransferase [Ferruginibacter sp.]
MNETDIHNEKHSSPLAKKARTVYCTVTTDLTYDQRMIRICTSLAEAGYKVVLVGRNLRSSLPLTQQPFQQVRLNCLVEKGKLFYALYNLRLFFFLLLKKMDCVCAIDLDTILPVLFVSKIKRIKRVYDAHELFCEMKEIVTRPSIYKAWKKIEAYSVPQFRLGYTVNQPIAAEFKKMYAVDYAIIRNIALLRDHDQSLRSEKFILYQGAVNEGRSFETLIPAMKMVDAQLWICGDGNFLEQAKQLTAENELGNKVIFKGKLAPAELRAVTSQAYIGVTLFENKGLSNYYSLANRFFDYIHAEIPQLCVDYPVYRAINDEIQVAVLVKELDAENIARELNNLIRNEVVYEHLRENCKLARKRWNWQQEEKSLIGFYEQLFNDRPAPNG